MHHLKIQSFLMAGFVLTFSSAALIATEGSALAVGRAVAAKSAKTVNLDIGVKGNEMLFDKTLLEAPAGAKVNLTLKNNSKILSHNFVLVKPGAEKEVDAAGLKAGMAKSFVPDSPKVLAHTKLLSPGASETIHFTAPAKAGEYPYVCTFPGHAETMKGVLKVK